jgi:hypothetical protein
MICHGAKLFSFSPGWLLREKPNGLVKASYAGKWDADRKLVRTQCSDSPAVLILGVLQNTVNQGEGCGKR